MTSSSFIFEGFLPRKRKDREEILFEISNNHKTTILFESPNRLFKLLQELRTFCGGDRDIQVSREMTKKFEENIYCSIDEGIDYFSKKEILGEITLVIKGVNKKQFTFNKVLIKKELHELIDAGLSLSAASKYLAKKNNLTKNMVYNLI